MMKQFFTCFFLCVLCFGIAYAQDDDSSSVSQSLKSFLGIGAPKLGMLVQWYGEVRNTSDVFREGGDFRAVQLLLQSSFAKRFSFLFQANMKERYQLLDLRLSYNYNSSLNIDLGQFKTYFGREFLKNESELLFSKRAWVSDLLGPQRQTGIQIRGSFIDSALVYGFGVFNGQGINSYTSSDPSLFNGRVMITPFCLTNSTTHSKIEIGLSGALSTENRDNLVTYTFARYTRFYGIDTRMEWNDYWFEGEYILYNPSDNPMFDGFNLDIARKITPNTELALRYQKFTYQYIFDPQQREDGASIGCNWYPENELKVQLNLSRNFYQNVNTFIAQVQYAFNAKY